MSSLLPNTTTTFHGENGENHIRVPGEKTPRYTVKTIQRAGHRFSRVVLINYDDEGNEIHEPACDDFSFPTDPEKQAIFLREITRTVHQANLALMIGYVRR